MTECTPFELVTSRQPQCPVSYPHPKVVEDKQSTEEFKVKLLYEFRKLSTKARHKIGRNLARVRKYHDRNAHAPPNYTLSFEEQVADAK